MSRVSTKEESEHCFAAAAEGRMARGSQEEMVEEGRQYLQGIILFI